MGKEYLRPDEVAEKLNVSKRTVYNLMKDVDNPLRSVNVKGSIRVKATDLENYIKKNKHKPWE
jgi:excisionase family DNA binding protein